MLTSFRPAFAPEVTRWQAWPPRRALELEQLGPQFLEEQRELEAGVGEGAWIDARAEELATDRQQLEPMRRPRAPGAWESEIDPQYPVFGNPLTSTVRENFLIAKEELEHLASRIADLDAAWPDLSVIDGGTWE